MSEQKPTRLQDATWGKLNLRYIPLDGNKNHVIIDGIDYAEFVYDVDIHIPPIDSEKCLPSISMKIDLSKVSCEIEDGQLKIKGCKVPEIFEQQLYKYLKNKYDK